MCVYERKIKVEDSSFVIRCTETFFFSSDLTWIKFSRIASLTIFLHLGYFRIFHRDFPGMYSGWASRHFFSEKVQRKFIRLFGVHGTSQGWFRHSYIETRRFPNVLIISWNTWACFNIRKTPRVFPRNIIPHFYVLLFLRRDLRKFCRDWDARDRVSQFLWSRTKALLLFTYNLNQISGVYHPPLSPHLYSGAWKCFFDKLFYEHNLQASNHATKPLNPCLNSALTEFIVSTSRRHTRVEAFIQSSTCQWLISNVFTSFLYAIHKFLN